MFVQDLMKFKHQAYGRHQGGGGRVLKLPGAEAADGAGDTTISASEVLFITCLRSFLPSLVLNAFGSSSLPARRFHESNVRSSAMTSAILNAVVSLPQTASASPSDISAKAHHNKHGKDAANALYGPMEQSRYNTSDGTSGLRVLFDPVFEARCSPFSFMGPKRYTEMPCEIEDLPFIDAVVISHSHYDHLSHPTIKRISQKYPGCHFFVGLGNKEWFTNMGISDKKVTELDWWDERTITLSAPPSEIGSVVSSNGSEGPDKPQNITATIGCLPCQHTSARTPFDKGHTLWASWSISSGGKKVWFGGDTGYRKPLATLPSL
ncbi:hypothetical protein KC335_g10 [Hortaea werneckii]|nr:hypothetical protein KC335_g10 [Hortaea werneckii]